MKKIEVEIEGITPLLMNSPKAMLEPQEAVRKTTRKYDPIVEAEKVAYRNSEGKLYVPSTALKGSILNASSWKKSGKLSLKPLIAAGIRISESELILDKQKYEIDLRTVVIQRSRVVKARPVLKNWKLNVPFEFDENLIPNPDVIKEVLIEAGQRVGLLDFRPQKMGEFGCFKVNKFKVIANGN